MVVAAIISSDLICFCPVTAQTYTGRAAVKTKIYYLRDNFSNQFLGPHLARKNAGRGLEAEPFDLASLPNLIFCPLLTFRRIPGEWLAGHCPLQADLNAASFSVIPVKRSSRRR